MTGTKQAEATWTRPWLLKLWYAYHYWYPDHCLLTQRGLNKKKSKSKKGYEFKKIILQRTCRCVYELITNRYSSVKHNHFFHSGIT
jgi:hypothetical protein